jgi:mRNA export factor
MDPDPDPGGPKTCGSGSATVLSSLYIFAEGTSANPNKDIEVQNPPDDSISSLAFSPPSLQQNFLVSGK